MKNTDRSAGPYRQAGRPQPAAGRGLPAGPGPAQQLEADRKYANDVLKVNSTPTFFINGEMVKGEQSFEEFDKRIKSLLKS